MDSKGNKRGPYFKWTENTKMPRQTLWSRSGKNAPNKVDDAVENASHSTTQKDDSTLGKDQTEQSSPTPACSASTDQLFEVGEPMLCDEEGNEDVTYTLDDNLTSETKDPGETATYLDYTCNNGDTNYADSDAYSTDEESESDDNDFQAESTPLYHGSRLTIATSMLLILTFALRHGLTGSAIHDLLSLIELHCLSENLCKSTVNLFYHFFSQVKKPMERHYFCGNCGNYLSQEESNACSVCSSKDIRYFITVPIAAQLRSILTRPDVSSALKKRANNPRSTFNDIQDIYDGHLYKNHFDDDGFFHGSTHAEKMSQIHLSLQINTDGVSLFKTSRFGIWPIYGIINELPPSIRFQKENRLFIGLWFGEDKPQMNVFLTPLVKEMNDLYSEGTNIDGKTCRVIILSSVADAPARSLMMNFIQFNGKFGCGNCYAPGERLQVGNSGGFSRVYPYDLSSESGHAPSRQHSETAQHGENVDKEYEASNKKNVMPKFGIKGSSVLSFLPLYDIIKGTTVDYMHCVFLGVTKMFMSAWFDSKYHKERWSLRKSLKVLSQRLVSIQPPHFIKRMPRAFEDLAHWKASEFRSFLLFFSLPVLSGILEEEYLAHWMLLSQAIFILSSAVVTETGILAAQSFIMSFCLQVKDLYGARFETFNTHCLLHLCDKVRDLGPLWAHSCFYFEGFNGELRLLFHGTQNIHTQIMRAVCIQQAIPEMVQSLPANSSAKLLYEKMTSRRKITKEWTQIGKEIFAIGKFAEFDLPEFVKGHIVSGNVSIVSCFKFLRISLNSQIVQSTSYGRVKRGQNYTVCYDEDSFGFVKYYIKIIIADDKTKYFAVIKKLQLQPAPTSTISQDINHIVKETEEVEVIPIDSISGMCMYARLADENVFCIVKCPNGIEID